MRFALLAWATVLLLPLGCAATRPDSTVYQRQAVFKEEEYAPYESSTGNAAITGQTFMKTLGGDVKYGAGSTVIVVPVTSYSREWFEIQVLRDIAMSPPDSRADRFTRSTLANGEGRFRLDGLPAGDYYVACYVKWSIPSISMGLQQTGGWAFARAHTDSGLTVDVVATRPDYSTLTRMQGNAGAQDVVPLTAPFTIQLEGGSRIGATMVQHRSDGMLKASLASGETLYLNAARVTMILDSSGKDWTWDVMSNRKILRSE